MEQLIKNLTDKEINFVCTFANMYIKQIPYIDKTNVNGLNNDYLIKMIKRKINKGLLIGVNLTFANIVIIKNNLKKV